MTLYLLWEDQIFLDIVNIATIRFDHCMVHISSHSYVCYLLYNFADPYDLILVKNIISSTNDRAGEPWQNCLSANFTVESSVTEVINAEE